MRRTPPLPIGHALACVLFGVTDHCREAHRPLTPHSGTMRAKGSAMNTTQTETELRTAAKTTRRAFDAAFDDAAYRVAKTARKGTDITGLIYADATVIATAKASREAKDALAAFEAATANGTQAQAEERQAAAYRLSRIGAGDGTITYGPESDNLED